ncbi:unnamed protein product, partial [Polarella glacialis]
FRMTQMLEMNSMMLDQLQEHVGQTYNRLRDIVVWVWALKDSVCKPSTPALEGGDPSEASKPDAFDSREARDAELDRIRRRCRVLLVLLGGFLFLLLRDNRRLRKDMAADGAWLK